MRGRSHTKLIVALLLALVASMPALASTIRWFCDGRACGISLCCCDQSDAAKTDPNCRQPEAPSTKSSLCAAGCGCTAVVITADTPTASLQPTSAPPVPGVFVLPTAPRPLALALVVPLTQPALPDYRGPPVVATTLPASGLRAPPAS
ncbi:MAG: hypothetical protein QM758_12990 [Armatimonas sp.]